MHDRRVPYGLHHPEAHSVIGPVHLHHGELLRNDTASRLPTEQLSGLSGKTENTLCADLHPRHKPLIPLQMRNHLSATRRLSVYPGLPTVHHTDLTHIYEPHLLLLRARGPRPRAKTQHKKRSTREYINSSTYGFTALLLSSPCTLPERTLQHARIMFQYDGKSNPADVVQNALRSITEQSSTDLLMQENMIRFAHEFLSHENVQQKHVVHVCTTMAQQNGDIASNGLQAIAYVMYQDRRYITYAKAVTTTLKNVRDPSVHATRVIDKLSEYIARHSAVQSSWESTSYGGAIGGSSPYATQNQWSSASLSQKRENDRLLAIEPVEKKAKAVSSTEIQRKAFVTESMAAFKSLTASKPGSSFKTAPTRLFSDDTVTSVSKHRIGMNTGMSWDTRKETPKDLWETRKDTPEDLWDTPKEAPKDLWDTPKETPAYSQLVRRDPFADTQIEPSGSRSGHQSFVSLRGHMLDDHIKMIFRQEVDNVSKKIESNVMGSINASLDVKFEKQSRQTEEFQREMRVLMQASRTAPTAPAGVSLSDLGITLKHKPAEYTIAMITDELLNDKQSAKMREFFTEAISDARNLKIHSLLKNARTHNNNLRILLDAITKDSAAAFHDDWISLTTLAKHSKKPAFKSGADSDGSDDAGTPRSGSPPVPTHSSIEEAANKPADGAHVMLPA